MLAGLRACAGLSAREALRSRSGWILALYAGALGLAVPATSDVLPAGRVEAVSGVLHAVTLVFGALVVLTHASRGIPLDVRRRFLSTVFVKPVSPGSYFLGRLLGAFLVATLFSVVAVAAGGVALAATARVWGERLTVETAAERPISVVPEGNGVRILWGPTRRVEGELAARITLVNNPYDTPALALSWRRGTGGPAAESATRLVAGKRIVDLPVPPDLAGEEAPLELAIAPEAGSLLPGPNAWAAPPALIARGRREFRLWAGHVAVLWATLLFAAGTAVFLSSFCAWPLAFSAAAIVLLAAHSHAFLKLLPQALEPKTLSGLFTPTIYHTHGHGHAHDHHGHDHDDPDAPAALRAFAAAAVPVLLAAIPDLAALESADRLAAGTVTTAAEFAGLAARVLARLAPLALLGAFFMTRRSLE